jgi:hypothetical protein
MAIATRGVIYIVWGDATNEYLDRSIASLKQHHPDLPVHVQRVTPRDPKRGLREKCAMAALTPFDTTLYLDVDTTVMGNLDFAFEQAERFGIACAICESPWLRRYGQGARDLIEYNTGVIFFSRSARKVMDRWDQLADIAPAASQWTKLDNVIRGGEYDDQASFGATLREMDFNPFVLPMNYNFRPMYYKTAFLPLKIWHDYFAPPEGLCKLSLACERGQRPVTLVQFASPNTAPPPHLRKTQD